MQNTVSKARFSYIICLKQQRKEVFFMRRGLPFIMAALLLAAVMICLLCFTASGTGSGGGLEGARFLYADDE